MWNFLLATVLLPPIWNVSFRLLIRWLAGRGECSAHLEVERKYSLAKHNHKHLKEELILADFSFWCRAEMKDWFIPSRDKSELLRIRREDIDGEVVHILTVKSWVATADGGRERLEKERKIGAILALTLLGLNRLMNGTKLLTLKKTRDLYRGSLANKNAVVSIDETKDLGRYSGFYLEVEVLAARDEDTLLIQNAIEDFVAKIAAGAEPVRESYRDLLERSRT